VGNVALGALLLAVFLGYALFEYALGRLIARGARAIWKSIREEYRKANGQ
jgi:hypothetical protein